MSWLKFFLLEATITVAGASEVTIPATDARIGYSGYVGLKTDPASQRVGFDRKIDEPGKGYRWSSPGTRIKIRTDSPTVKALVRYTAAHTSKTARNAIGTYRIDGSAERGGIFSTASQTIERGEESVTVEFPKSDDDGMHDYEIVLPYADSVEFAGFVIESGARVDALPPVAQPRYVAYGDSITQGFTATRTDRTYAFLLAEAQGWQLINLGLGGRQSNATDGELIRKLEADHISLFVGTNDWQQGTAPQTLQQNLRAVVKSIRERQPFVPIFLLTPLWVSPNWKPAEVCFPLEDYTRAVSALAAELQDLGDHHVHLIRGDELIDHEERYFDSVLVHPNDAGFAQMAERLSARLRLIQ